MINYIVAAVIVLGIGASTYAYINRAEVVHSELQATREMVKEVSCSAPGYCYGHGMVNGELKYFYGYHSNCSGNQKVRGIEKQIKYVYSNDKIKIKFPFTKTEEITACAV